MLRSEESFSFETEILRKGTYIQDPTTNPEVAPIYMTTAFNVEDLDDLEERYREHGFCYNRNRNPNRSALAELMTYLEEGEDSVICSSGMAAISTAVLSIVQKGDHVLSDKTLYGESMEIFQDFLSWYGVETTFVDFTNLEEVQKHIHANTKMLYTETVSNPLMTVPDLHALAEIAHQNNAALIVDNTFMTAALCRPLKLGADVVVNSLTKFANGHSDAVCGALTGKKSFVERAHHVQVLLGSQADPFSSWLVQRGIRTMSLRVERQSLNGTALAQALSQCPYVRKVNHPSLETHAQHELAKRQFLGFGGMLSIELPDDRDKMNKFMRALSLAHYAMTLGGYRTSLSYPALSSHSDMSEEERVKIGITNGLMRISCGIENTEDLVNDFMHALEVAYKN